MVPTAYTGSGVERRGSVVVGWNLVAETWFGGGLLYRVWCACAVSVVLAGADGTNLEASAEEFPKYLAGTTALFRWYDD